MRNEKRPPTDVTVSCVSRHIIEVVQQYEDGKFLIVKDPIKVHCAFQFLLVILLVSHVFVFDCEQTMLTLYAVPSDDDI